MNSELRKSQDNSTTKTLKSKLFFPVYMHVHCNAHQPGQSVHTVEFCSQQPELTSLRVYASRGLLLSKGAGDFINNIVLSATCIYIHSSCSAQNILSTSALCVSGAGNHCPCLASGTLCMHRHSDTMYTYILTCIYSKQGRGKGSIQSSQLI